MKKLLILCLLLSGLAHADDTTVKALYNLTTKNVATFETKILKNIVMNKTYYEGNLKEFQVAVVVHGGAYRFFVKDLQSTIYKNDKKLAAVYGDLKKRIATLADTYDVEFLICAAGMKKNKLAAKDMVKFVKIIPNATIGLIDKQNEDFAYIPVAD